MKLADHQSATTTKMLFLGDSGAGKTGALSSLASAGYNLRIIDVDAGLDVLANLLKSSRYAPGSLDRVEFETLTDRMRKSGGKLIPAKATVWQRAVGLLDDWGKQATEEAKRRWLGAGGAIAEFKPPPSATLGGLATWGPQDILVIDSLSMLSTAALNFILAMNARLGQKPFQSDWFEGQQLIEGMLQTLYDEGVTCNVIVIAHITYLGEEGGPSRGYPNTLGKALPPRVGRYFNSALLARTTGAGTALKRKILTNTSGIIELKNTAPTRVRPEYDLETGLAEYFRDVRSTEVTK